MEKEIYIYTPLLEPTLITEHNWPEGTMPLVFIKTMTYMHEKFIRECIEGILFQKTTFPVLVLIHDDASTDKTQEIIREYEQKYPRLIKVYCQKENMYIKDKKEKQKLMSEFISWQKGKYYAECEGDDYWIDPLKLQKQVSFMEQNDDFSICFHPVKYFYENEKKLIDNNSMRDVDVMDVTDIKYLARYNYIHTPSVLLRYKKEVYEDINKFPNLGIGDYLNLMLYAKYGKIKRLPDKMAVYRIHKGGAWSEKPIEYKIPIMKKVIMRLMMYFVDNNEVFNILMEQFEQYGKEKIYGSLYLDTGNGFNENEKIECYFNGDSNEISCDLNDNIKSLRLDPIEGYSCVICDLMIYSNNNLLNFKPLNGFTDNLGNIIFTDKDPQILIFGAENQIKINYKILKISDISYLNFLKNYILTCQNQEIILKE